MRRNLYGFLSKSIVATLAISACANPVKALTFDFSSGIDSTYWTETYTQSGLYTVTTGASGVTFTKTGTTNGGLQYVGLQLDLAKATTTGSITGDFSITIDFSNASLDDGGSLNQVQLNLFTSSGCFEAVRDSYNSGNAHVWVGSVLSGYTPTTASSGTFTITRSGSTLSAYLGTTLLGSQTNSDDITSLTFTLQNNSGSDFSSVVSFNNFTITGTNIVPEPSTYALFSGCAIGLIGFAMRRRK